MKLSLNRDFDVFWVGQSFSTLGDAFAFVALPLLVLEATGSVRQMGLLTATFGAGQIAAGVFSGAIVDAVDRRRLMLACDLVRALLYASIPAAWASGHRSVPLLFVVTALGSMTGNLFSVAYVAATANLVQPTELAAANSRLQVTQALGYVVGPTLAGIVAAKLGPSAAIGVDAASFAVSCASLVAVRLRITEAVRERANIWKRLSAGAGFLLRQPTLRAVAAIFVLTSMVDAGVLDLFIYLVKHDLGRSDAVVGALLGVGAIGAAVGAAATPWALRRFGFGACLLGGTAFEALAMLAIGMFASLALVGAAAVVFLAATTVRSISSISLRQRITPDHLLGRVTAAFWTAVACMMPLGAALTTSAAASLGSRRVVATCGALIAVVAVLGALTPARQSHPEPADPQAR